MYMLYIIFFKWIYFDQTLNLFLSAVDKNTNITCLLGKI